MELEGEARRRLIDALMAGPPADLPSIIVIGDDDVFGFRPLPPVNPEPQGP